MNFKFLDESQKNNEKSMMLAPLLLILVVVEVEEGAGRMKQKVGGQNMFLTGCERV